MRLFLIVLAILQVPPLGVHCQQSITSTELPNGMLSIRNGVCGVVVPSEKSLRSKEGFLAPLQSFITGNGALTDNTTNLLEATAMPISATMKIVKGTEEILCVIRYLFNDNSYYLCSLKVARNSKTIVIEEDSNNDVSYQVQVSNAAPFDQARYRGWSSTTPLAGYEPDGKAYREENNRTPMDATLDLTYKTAFEYPFMSNWDPAGGEVNTGRYWQLYRKNGGPNDNLFGIFQGRASRLIGNKFIGVRLYSKPATSGVPEHAGIKMVLVRRGPDNSFSARKRFQWCAYISTKKDLLPPGSFQPIGIEMNRVSGVASKLEAYGSKPMIMSKNFLQGTLYLDSISLNNMVKRVKSDKEYYDQFVTIHPTFKPTLDAWRFPDSSQSIKNSLLAGYRNLRKELEFGDGIHSFYLKYWMGSINFKRTAMQLAGLFADPTVKFTPNEKKELSEMMGLIARILWDDDYVPFFDSSGINFGTENMLYQYRNNGRNFFAMIFAEDPEFRDRALKVAKETRSDLIEAIATNGIPFASPHYTQATLDPILYNMLQLKQAGIADLFLEEKTRLTAFARFYTSLLTPPSVRFSGNRKLISMGDGSEESAPTFALLGAGLRSIDAQLSDDLYYLFEHGPVRQSLFGELGLAASFDKHQGQFRSSSAHFNGYLSHARSGVNSRFETAAWIINGETYRDHRNDDRGQFMIYALGAPLSINWNAFYSPRTSDARIKSLVIPEQLFPSWKGASQPIYGEDKLGNPWTSSEAKDFGKFEFSTFTSSVIRNDKNTWSRRFYMIHQVPEEPVIVLFDSISQNPNAVWSMTFMSDAIKENGSAAPAPQHTKYGPDGKKELPSASAEKSLKSGWNQFSFTGQHWALHPSKGIDWEMFTYTTSASSYTLSQWTNNWQNETEQKEFKVSNGKPYEESQHIFRWRSAKPFLSVIVPSPKGSTEKLKLTRTEQGSITLSKSNRSYLINPGYFEVTESPTKKTIGVFSDDQVTISSFTFSGGIVCLRQDGGEIRIYTSGKDGKRTIVLPFDVRPEKTYPELTTTRKNKTTIEINHSSKQAGSTGESGYSEFIFYKQ